MKKTYINPEMAVVKVATQQMLAVSNGTLSTKEDDKITTPGDFGGRSFDFFDED